jgi:hypothetical protein
LQLLSSTHIAACCAHQLNMQTVLLLLLSLLLLPLL